MTSADDIMDFPYGLHTNWAEATALYTTFTRVWGVGGEASLSLNTRGGQLRAQLSLGLGPPSHLRPGAPERGGPGPQDRQHHHDLHQHHHHPPGHPGGARRRQAPADRRRDAARRARYVAARAARDQEAAPATPACTSSSSTPNTVANQVTSSSLATLSTLVPPSPTLAGATLPTLPTSDSLVVTSSLSTLPIPSFRVTPPYNLASSTPSLTTVGQGLTRRRWSRSVASILDLPTGFNDPHDLLPQLDGQLEEKKEAEEKKEDVCELFGVTDPRDGETSYSLPWGRCPLDTAGAPRPPRQVRHPKWGVGTYDDVGDREDVLLYSFTENGWLAEIGLDPSTLPQPAA